MNVTGYNATTTFSKGLAFNGGFCKWWFIEKNNIATFPDVDPLTQYLKAEPILKAGQTWKGPVMVPNSQLGFQEVQTNDKPGIYYKQKVSGFYPGDSGTSRTNLENLPYEQMIIVGKMRSGGLFLMLGNEEYGLIFNHTFNSDQGAGGTAGSDFSFAYESLYKGLILPQFLGLNVTPAPDGSSGSGPTNLTTNNTEVIFFENVNQVDFSWTNDRKSKFGVFPLIEVWFLNEEDNYTLSNVPITTDVLPPNQTSFSVYNGSNQSGFIIIK